MNQSSAYRKPATLDSGGFNLILIYHQNEFNETDDLYFNKNKHVSVFQRR